jgi:hypothetical protein
MKAVRLGIDGDPRLGVQRGKDGRQLFGGA